MLYRSPDFYRNSFHNLQKYKESILFCDVEIEVSGKIFYAHKVLLASCCSYFHAMFNSNLTEHKTGRINIQNLSPKIFETLLNFMYTSEIEINDDNATDLISAADMLNLPDVMRHCSDFLITRLDRSNCIGIFEFSGIYHCTKLESEAMEYIEANFLDVVEEEEFCNVSKENLKKLISSEHLNIDRESQVFNAAMKWIMNDPCNRRKYIFYLLEEIRLLLIAEKQLVSFACKCTDLSVSVVLRKVLKDVRIEQQLLEIEEKAHNWLSSKYCVPRTGTRKSIFVVGGYIQLPGQRWGESSSLKTLIKLDTYRKVWTVEPPMKFRRNGHSSAFVNDRIYVIGGENNSMITDSVEVYEPSVQIWRKASSMLLPRCQHSCCVSNGLIYIFGGWIGSEVTRSIECYDPAADEWRRSGNTTHTRYGIGACSIDDTIYLVGGRDASDCGVDCGDFQSFNPVTEEFFPLKPLPLAVSFASVIVFNGLIYVIGGLRGIECLKSVYCYSIKNDSWSEVASMSTERSCASAAVANGKIIVIGGRITSDNYILTSFVLDSVEVYDPELDVWTKSNYPSMPVGRCEATAQVI